MAHVRATVRVPERRTNDTLVSRAQAAGWNVDSRRVDVAVARPFEIVIHGRPVDRSVVDLWEDLPDVEVVEVQEAADGDG